MALMKQILQIAVIYDTAEKNNPDGVPPSEWEWDDLVGMDPEDTGTTIQVLKADVPVGVNSVVAEHVGIAVTLLKDPERRLGDGPGTAIPIRD